MRYQHVGLSNGHCLGTITIFQLDLCDLFCACAVGILLYCKYYGAKLAQTCCLGPLTTFRILSLRLIHAMHALTSRVNHGVSSTGVAARLRIDVVMTNDWRLRVIAFTFVKYCSGGGQHFTPVANLSRSPLLFPPHPPLQLHLPL